MIHFICKDIIYFHLLFWPAMRMGAGFNLPEAVYVHGFLTVNGEKMSKSRGTFITARRFLDTLNPAYLRFYYAAHLGNRVNDVDFNFDHFRDVVNAQLIDNLLNFANRVLTFANNRLEGRLLPCDGPPDPDRVMKISGEITRNYDSLELSRVVQGLSSLGDMGNQYIQTAQPWAQVKSDAEEARRTISRSVDLIRRITILMAPILPRVTDLLWGQLGCEPMTIRALARPLGEHTLSPAQPILPRIDAVDLKD